MEVTFCYSQYINERPTVTDHTHIYVGNTGVMLSRYTRLYAQRTMVGTAQSSPTQLMIPCYMVYPSR